MNTTHKPLLLRLTTLITALALCFGFFSLVPEGALRVSAEGTYTVQYYTRRMQTNGTRSTEDYGTMTFNDGDLFKAPDLSSYMNYHSTEWTDDEGTVYVVDTTPVTKNLVVYMDFEPTNYTVSFDVNGGTGTMDSITVVRNTEVALTREDFEGPKNTPSFLGRNTKADGSGDWYYNLYLAPENNCIRRYYLLCTVGLQGFV